MGGNKKGVIPGHFDSAEEAGEFWDTHSAADYWDEMEETEMAFDIKKRVFLVPVSDQVYQQVKRRAAMERRSVEEMVNALLEHELA
jgi:hypothetical protein